MASEDAEAFLRAMVAPLGTARRGVPLPGIPFSREAVANAFVMLGLVPESAPRLGTPGCPGGQAPVAAGHCRDREHRRA